jgi:hypothetical protein
VSNPSLPARLLEKLRRLSALLIVLWVIVIGFRPMMDNVDLGWHVAQGRWMVHHFSFYRHDVFNYPNLNRPVVDEYPLFQVVLFLAWKLGWLGPCLLTSATYAWLAVVLLRAGKHFNLKNSALYTLCVVVMFFYLQVAHPLRPHMVTYLCTAIVGVFLLRQREAPSWKTFWPMAALQIAWVNCHSGFVIGPAMVALFGMEMVARRWIAKKTFPTKVAEIWLGAFVFIALACFINPYGWSRFYLPFYQDQLESIRVYVGEMQPLGGGSEFLFGRLLTIVTLTAVVLGLIARQGATAYSFLILAVFFLIQAQSVQKAWPVFGVFVPLVILASGAFSRTVLKPKFETQLNMVGHFGVAILTGIVLLLAFNPGLPTSIEAQWKQVDEGRSELAYDAVAWMKLKNIHGRIFQRCEIGGELQQEDFGETFADTGFGKYDEAFIHEVGLVNERPGMIPRYIAAYQPDFVVCCNFSYQWAYYLRQNGWRPIFYSPNSSVWTEYATRPDLPTVTDDAVRAAFDHDLSAYGLPDNVSLIGRNLIALNSMGLEEFTFAKLTGLPADSHKSGWYWEDARIMCFSEPAFSPEHRRALLDEAKALGDDHLTADFRAHCAYWSGDPDGALKILQSMPPEKLGNVAAALLLRIEIDRHDPAALALAVRNDCFDLGNGRRWQYLAEAAQQAGHLDLAHTAWLKAVFYAPDDSDLMSNASSFAAATSDTELLKAITNSTKVYGVH